MKNKKDIRKTWWVAVLLTFTLYGYSGFWKQDPQQKAFAAGRKLAAATKGTTMKFKKKEQMVQLKYEYSISGYPLGNISTKRRVSKHKEGWVLSAASEGEIRIDYEGYKYDLEFQEEVRFLEHDLLDFKGSWKEDNVLMTVEAHWEEELLKMKVGIPSGSQWFSNDRNKFDFFSPSIPHLLPMERFKEQGQAITQRILDVNSLEIIEGTFEVTGTENVKIGNKSFPCYVVSTNNRNKKARSWYAKDDMGYFLVKEEVDDLSNAYQYKVQLMEWDRTN